MGGETGGHRIGHRWGVWGLEVRKSYTVTAKQCRLKKCYTCNVNYRITKCTVFQVSVLPVRDSESGISSLLNYLSYLRGKRRLHRGMSLRTSACAAGCPQQTNWRPPQMSPSANSLWTCRSMRWLSLPFPVDELTNINWGNRYIEAIHQTGR